MYETEDIPALGHPGDDVDPYDSDDSFTQFRQSSATYNKTNGRNALFGSGPDAGVDGSIETSGLPGVKGVKSKLASASGTRGGQRDAYPTVTTQQRLRARQRFPQGQGFFDDQEGDEDYSGVQGSSGKDDDLAWITSRRKKESDANRLRRLKAEMHALEQSLARTAEEEAKKSTSTSTSTTEPAQKDQQSEIVRSGSESESESDSEEDVIIEDGKQRRVRRRPKPPTTAELMRQLSEVKTGLFDRLEVGIDDSLAVQRTPTDGAAPGADRSLTRHLVNQLGRFSTSPSADSGNTPTRTATQAQNQNQNQNQTVPPKKEWTADEVSEFDRRLGHLEKSIGSGTIDATSESSTTVQPVLSSLNRLENIVSLLAEPRQLDSISRRIKLLLTDLEKSSTLISKTSNGISSGRGVKTDKASRGETGEGIQDGTTTVSAEEMQKLNALFALLPRIDPVLPIISPLLTRLRSLDALHSSASSFAETLDALEVDSNAIEQGHEEMNELVKKLEEGIESQGDRIKNNWESLETRLDALGKRLVALEH